MSSTGSQEAPLAKLPRGPHQLSVDEVRASQRARLTRAMLDLVGEQGFAQTSVPQVVAAAKVSRNAFYELFSDKVDCYLAAVDEEIEELLAALRPPRPAMSWLEILRHSMRVYAGWWQARPGRARAYLVELPQAGERAVEQRERTYEAFGRLFTRMAELIREDHPDLPPLRPLAVRAVVLTITEEIAADVRAGKVDRLDERIDDFVWLVVRLLADDATADEVL